MNSDLTQILEDLKVSPEKESVDHIQLLYQLSWNYNEKDEWLKPLIVYFHNGLDDLPTLKEKPLWQLEKFNEVRKPFTESHFQLVEIIENILNTPQQHIN
jgi:hypothetical protein